MMEETWERRCNLLNLDMPAIKRLLDPAFSGRPLLDARIITGGKCSTNYRISLVGYQQPVLLRIYRRDPEVCAQETCLLHLLQDRIPVSTVIYSCPDPAAYGWAYAIHSWMDGVSMDTVSRLNDDYLPVADQLGRILAVLNSITFPSAGFFGPNLQISAPFENIVDAYLSHMEECLFHRQAGINLGESYARHLWKAVETNRSCLDDLKFCRSLVHADFKPSNILLHNQDGTWNAAALLDWEFAHSGTSISDIGQLFRREKQYPPSFQIRFIQSYVEHGGFLPPDWKRMSKLLDLVHLCDLIDTASERSNVIADVRELIINSVKLLAKD
jgi:fructokinase